MSKRKRKRTRSSPAAEHKVASWSKRFGSTWLSSPEACRAMDHKLAELVGAHLGRQGAEALPEHVLALRCERTAKLLEDLGRSPSNTLVCTLLLTLLSESLLCAEAGGIFRRETADRFEGDPRTEAQAMRLLRNAVCHPVATSTNGGESAISALANYLEINFVDEGWASDVRKTPGRLADDRNVALFALRLVDSLGRWQAEHWGVRLRGARRQ